MDSPRRHGGHRDCLFMPNQEGSIGHKLRATCASDPSRFFFLTCKFRSATRKAMGLIGISTVFFGQPGPRLTAVDSVIPTFETRFKN